MKIIWNTRPIPPTRSFLFIKLDGTISKYSKPYLKINIKKKIPKRDSYEKDSTIENLRTTKIRSLKIYIIIISYHLTIKIEIFGRGRLINNPRTKLGRFIYDDRRLLLRGGVQQEQEEKEERGKRERDIAGDRCKNREYISTPIKDR